jgi:Family of unknown function (DUF5977)
MLIDPRDKLAVITHEPLRFSKNPLEINIETMNPALEDRAGIRYFLEIWTPKFYNSNIYEMLYSSDASEEPPTDLGGGSVEFPGATVSIEEVLDGQLALKRPAFGQKSISVCVNQTMKFFTKFRKEKTGEATESGTLPSEWVIRAGINERYFEEWKDNFWTRYIGGNNRRFLTFQANNKKVVPHQPEYLYFLTNFSPLPSQLCLRMIVKFDDGTESDPETVMSISGITAFTVYCFPVGAMVLGLDTRPETVISYEVWVSDKNYLRLSEIRNYIIDTKYYRNAKFLIYNNALGGYDTVMFTGQSKETMNVERQVFERQTGFNHAPTYAERIVNRITGERALTVNTGWMSKTNFLACENLLFATDVLLITDREYIPLLNTSPALEYPVDDEKLIGRELLFTYSNRETLSSALPISPVQPTRATGWRPYSYGGCQLDANGIRTGKQTVAMLEQYYLDNNQARKPAVIKPNMPDTEGYLPPQNTASCSAATTPFRSVAVSRVGSFIRNNCGIGLSGSKAMVTVPAGLYGSEISQADANAKAEARWFLLDTQEYANDPANGAVCSAAPELYTVPGVPAGRFNWRWLDKQNRNANTMIQGGPSCNSGNNAELAYGNAWPIAQNTNPASLIYPQNSNDVTLPINPGTSYQIFVIGYNVPKRCKVYYNGICKIDKTISTSEFQAFDGSYQILLTVADGNVPLPDGCFVYCTVEDV